jgi:hypothetical protein
MEHYHGSQKTRWKTMGSFMKFGDSLRCFEILKNDGSLILIFFFQIPKTNGSLILICFPIPKTAGMNERIAPHMGINNN